MHTEFTLHVIVKLVYRWWGIKVNGQRLDTWVASQRVIDPTSDHHLPVPQVLAAHSNSVHGLQHVWALRGAAGAGSGGWGSGFPGWWQTSHCAQEEKRLCVLCWERWPSCLHFVLIHCFYCMCINTEHNPYLFYLILLQATLLVYYLHIQFIVLL